MNTLHVQEVFLKLSSLKYFLHLQSIQYFPCATSISEAIQFNKNTSCICKVFNTLYMLQVFLGLVFRINTFVTCKVSNTLHKYLFEFYKFAYPHTIWVILFRKLEANKKGVICFSLSWVALHSILFLLAIFPCLIKTP